MKSKSRVTGIGGISFKAEDAPKLRAWHKKHLGRALRKVGCAVLCTAFSALAYKEVPPPEKVELPPPLTAAQSLAAIQVPAGMEVELVAAEPMVMDPIDIAWDADGRMWVVEMADYPLGIDGRGRPGGRIRILESTKGDGRYDKSTVFADNLSYPTSIRPWRNGVLVTAIPSILLLEDTDGDGRADKTTKLFSGLGEGNQQHLANGLQWGLDGWLHLANGDSGGKVAALKSKEVLEIGRRDFRIQPDTGAMEVLSGQSQFGRNRDDWGNWFGCNNSNPIYHYALEEHYLRRNPQYIAPSAVVAVSRIPGAAPVFPASRTVARFNDPQGFNHFTSACSVMVYRDELLGAAFTGNVFVCEPVHNLVHREIVRPAGATFTGERAAPEQRAEFFASTDGWSRFTAARTGPDGALYIVDMYRLVIEHPKWIPDAWLKVIGNVRAGEDKGRIYRVRPKGVALRPVPKLARADLPALVAALENPSGTVRDLAQQQLIWRQGKAAGPALEQLLHRSARPVTRGQVLATLATIGGLTPGAVVRGLDDLHPGVRRLAVRLSENFTGTHPELLPRITELAADADAGVRQQVAYTLGEWKQPAAGIALAKLVQADDDRFVRAAAMSSALGHAETLFAELRATRPADDPVVMELAVATGNASALGRGLVAIAARQPAAGQADQFDALARLLDGLQRNNSSLGQWEKTGGAALLQPLAAADTVFAAARTRAANVNAGVPERIAAVSLLGRGRSRQDEDLDRLLGLLGPQSPGELQLAAVTALGRINRPTIATRLLDAWSSYGPAVRTAVLDLVLSRPAWANLLLDRVEANPALAAEIDGGRKQALAQHNNATLAARATTVFNAGVDANRQKVIDRYAAAIQPLTGVPAKGALVFAATCAVCHKFGEVPGRLIGPDLAAVKDRTPPYLLTHILDPNRAVEDRYILYTATTEDGRTLAGRLAAETGNSVTLQGLDGSEQVVLRKELRTLASTGRSLMPEGLESAVNEQAMADLIAFLGEAAREK